MLHMYISIFFYILQFIWNCVVTSIEKYTLTAPFHPSSINISIHRVNPYEIKYNSNTHHVKYTFEPYIHIMKKKEEGMEIPFPNNIIYSKHTHLFMSNTKFFTKEKSKVEGDAQWKSFWKCFFVHFHFSCLRYMNICVSLYIVILYTYAGKKEWVENHICMQ